MPSSLNDLFRGPYCSHPWSSNKTVRGPYCSHPWFSNNDNMRSVLHPSLVLQQWQFAVRIVPIPGPLTVTESSGSVLPSPYVAQYHGDGNFSLLYYYFLTVQYIYFGTQLQSSATEDSPSSQRLSLLYNSDNQSAFPDMWRVPCIAHSDVALKPLIKSARLLD
jgi:hypothetical protein